MHLTHTTGPNGRRWFTAGAATLAAVLYAARSVWALTAGELDHMAHTVSSGQPLVIAAAAAMATTLLGLRASLRTSNLPRVGARSGERASRLTTALPTTALLIASVGLLWVGAARLIELLGTPGPWGLYSGPGLVAFLGGLAVAGLLLRRGKREQPETATLGRILMAIALLRAGAGLVSMTLFNVLGRDLGANVAATRAGHGLRVLEALCWLALALLSARAGALPAAPSNPPHADK